MRLPAFLSPLSLKLTGLSFAVLLASCGGGTSGTGLNAFEGTVTNQKGAPLQGVSVTLEST